MSEEFDAGVYDFLASTAAAAQESAQEIIESSSFTTGGTSTGQAALWDGANYVPGSISGDSGFGLSVTVVTSPSFGLQITVSTPSSMRSAIGAAAKANPAIVAATIPLAKITPAGADGSITVNAEGICTAYVAPT